MESEWELDIGALLGQLQSGTFGHLSPDDLIRAHPKVVEEMRGFDPIKTAATFGGLLLEPKLQANCLRLEALVHLALIVCDGKRKPGRKQIQRWFEALGAGQCGLLEDPAEDVFVSNIETSRGNFRIVEGLSESSAFYLQRFVNLVDGLPDKKPFSFLRERVFALLSISDLICEKAGLSRYQLGEEFKQETVPSKLAENGSHYRGLVTVTDDDLLPYGVDVSLLWGSSFIFEYTGDLGSSGLGNSALERSPILVRDGTFYFALPTAASGAIRRVVFEFFCGLEGGREALLRNLAFEYESCFKEVTFLKSGPPKPVRFSRTKTGAFSALLMEADEGRYLSFVFFMDTLEGFENLGLLGRNPNPDQIVQDLDRYIDEILETARSRPNFRDCLTIVVSCGVGRAVNMTVTQKRRENWSLLTLSAADFWTLSWVDGFRNLSFWRVLTAQQKLKSLGVVLQNANGFLNLVAWARTLSGHLIPHGDVPTSFGDGPAFVMIEQNSLRLLRHEVARNFDPHVIPYIDGSYKSVRKINDSIFEEDRKLPLYASLEFVEGRGLSTAYLAPNRIWWAELETDKLPTEVSLYDRWQILTTWLPRFAAKLDSEMGDVLPKCVLWTVAFVGAVGDLPLTTKRASYQDALDAITFELDEERGVVSISAAEAFERAIFNEANIAERALIFRSVEAFFALGHLPSAAEKIEAIVNEIIPNEKARQSHRFRARNFRDYVHEQLSSPPVLMDDFDDATPRLGLGWRFRDRSLGDEIHGQTECTDYLNTLVASIEEEVCSEIREFNRMQLIEFALLQHERAVQDRDRWRRTSGALLALRRDQGAVMAKITEHEFKLNAVFQAARLLIEIAISECPAEGGRKPGDLDFCGLMSKALLAGHFGGISDAIRWDAIEPKLRVTPLGDVHLNYGYFDDVLVPFGEASISDTVVASIENYKKQLEEDDVREEISDALEGDILSAWQDEFGHTLESQRTLIDCLENLGIEEGQAIFAKRRSELVRIIQSQTKMGEQVVEAILDSWTLSPRHGWKYIPEGYRDADRQPWRFGRRLSVLRKPFLQIDEDADPTFIIAPGLVRDGFAYSLGNYYRGAFPHWQLNSKGMKQWAGKIFDKDGRDFGVKVADKMRELGWSVDVEVKITKLLRKGFDRDFGDVDVIAWDMNSQRVILMECKDLKYKKTPGEIAEQIADFRGEYNDRGKPDLLRKHLDRVSIIQRHEAELAKFVGMEKISKIEHTLVFRNPVPMRYAWSSLSALTQLHTFVDLGLAFRLRE